MRRTTASPALVRRRSLLKGLGAAGFLAAPVFREALAATQAAPLRLIVVSFPGGVTAPSNFTFGKYLAPLAPYTSDILLFQNLADPTLPPAAGHSGEQTMLTGQPGVSKGEDHPVSLTPDIVSVDQLVAQAIGGRTRFSSLQFAVQSDQPPMGDDVANKGRIVFSNGQPIAPIQDPKAMFARLFMGAAPAPAAGGAAPAPAPVAADPQAMAKLQALAMRRKSVLDLLTAQVDAIKGVVGTQEKQRLEEHLGALRELEKSLPGASASPAGGGVSAPGSTPAPASMGPPAAAAAGCKTPSGDASANDIQAAGAAMNEMLYQAINCDLTRVATMQWLNSQQGFSFTWLGVSKGHHPLQHTPGPDFDKDQTWLMSQVAVLVKRLKETPEGGGSMLDNCLLFVTSEMGDGSLHDASFVPALLAGKAGGAVRPGRTMDVAKGSRNNLLMSIGNAMGLKLTSIGAAKYCTGAYALG